MFGVAEHSLYPTRNGEFEELSPLKLPPERLHILCVVWCGALFHTTIHNRLILL
jgi:hypothetical protein